VIATWKETACCPHGRVSGCVRGLFLSRADTIPEAAYPRVLANCGGGWEG
jgi:hypothetical protein